MSAPAPTIADLLAAMSPEKRERCEFLIFELIRTLAPTEWTDEQIKDAFRPRAGHCVGYLYPAGQSPVSLGDRYPYMGEMTLS